MKPTLILLPACAAAAVLFASPPPARSATAKAAPANASRLPIKEVTVFKDGHAFVVHEGRLPTAGSDLVLDYLPAPVIGTFWAYSTDKAAKLTGVVAGQRRIVVERTALTLREMLEANVGAEALFTVADHASFTGTILGFPTRSPEELAATSPPNSGERLAEKGNVVLIKTAEGTKPLALERIQDVTFKQPLNARVAQEEFRNLLTLRLDWGGRAPARSAEVGLVYLQKGIRWIPGYKVDLDGKGKATIRLQATVLNELADLDGTTLQLVIGLPSFYFKDTLDPMALQQTAAQLSQFFQTDASRGRGSALAVNFSNAIMTQVARGGDYQGRGEPAPAGGDPSLPEGGKNEDLFVFTVRQVTLKKGERAVLPLAEFTVPYEDVFTLELPFAPPADLRRHFNTQQQSELARLFHAPKVTHKARLKNQSPYPFTTAPALLLREGRVLAQGMMTYAAVGASADLNITAALDIAVKKTDHETKRTPNAWSHAGHSYMRVDLEGKVRLTNHRQQPVEVEVVRHALGHIDSADHDGKVEMNNVFEGADFLPTDGAPGHPDWWQSYSWPWWWHHVNSVGRVTWKLALQPGQPVEIGYAWHYYWQ